MTITRATVRLDSVDPNSDWNLPPVVSGRILFCRNQFGPATLVVDGVVARHWASPLDALRWMQQSVRDPDARWVGFLSYDCGRWFESFDRTAVDDMGTPWFAFAYCEGAASSPPPGSTPGEHIRGTRVRSTFTPADYRHAVLRAIDYIAAGDVFQVNLSQRFDVATAASPAAVYDRLIARSPSPHAALVDFGNFAIASHSPELFLHVTPDRNVVTKPIKGTRPRLPGMEEELFASAKDAAELNMIVDLQRNDLGRVCEIGTVRVTRPRSIEAHPTVYHGVATIQGTLRADVDLVDLLAATFPGGSVTGAPKVRAMQIIDELEPVRRGPYCGAIGYLAAGGAVQFNVAIRTITLKNGIAHVNVGGGVVADSDPAAEYEETLVKARAMFDALGLA